MGQLYPVVTVTFATQGGGGGSVLHVTQGMGGNFSCYRIQFFVLRTSSVYYMGDQQTKCSIDYIGLAKRNKLGIHIIITNCYIIHTPSVHKGSFPFSVIIQCKMND